jgi:hypothetical protein
MHLVIIRTLLLNGGRLARASFSVCTVVHNTYQRILIQNTCRQNLATNSTSHYKTPPLHYSTPTTMSNARKIMMNLGKLQSKKYAKNKTQADRRETPENRNEGTTILPPSML